MNNPHYVTPEEAGEKDCAMRPDEYWCKGPKCMAWRWRPMGHQDLMKGYILPLPLVPEEPQTHGYCGMVRS